MTEKNGTYKAIGMIASILGIMIAMIYLAINISPTPKIELLSQRVTIVEESGKYLREKVDEINHKLDSLILTVQRNRENKR